MKIAMPFFIVFLPFLSGGFIGFAFGRFHQKVRMNQRLGHRIEMFENANEFEPKKREITIQILKYIRKELL